MPAMAPAGISTLAHWEHASGWDDEPDSEPGDDWEDALLPPLQPLTFESQAEERWFSQPKIMELVDRMRELGEKARLTATTQREKRLLQKFYSNDGLKRRVKLLFEPEVVKALERIWQAADTDGSHSIEKSEYLVMHRKVRGSCLSPPQTRPSAQGVSAP